MTILLDGMECADPAFRGRGDQPAVVVRLTEPRGRTALLLIDAGASPEALKNNLQRWFERQDLPPLAQSDGILKAILLSHVHTYNRVMAPPWAFDWRDTAESFRVAWELFGELPVQGPNLTDLCIDTVRIVGNPVARKLCGVRMRVTESGLAPIRYANGTLSRRAWTLTYPIAPEERAELPFQPYESVFVFRSKAGYLVYSVCSHALQPGQEPSRRPFHAIELVQEHIDNGDLPPGQIHSLVTGACGMEQMLTEYNDGKPVIIKENPGLLRSRLSALSERTGLQRVYLNHCSRHFEQFWPAFMEVFGDNNIQRALPGSCIPL